MANEQRSEAAEAPFWSTMWDRANTGAALADNVLMGFPSAAAGLVNTAVAPVVNPFLPDDYKLATTSKGVQEKKEEALKDAPNDFRALTEQYANPGNVGGLADDAAQSMLLFALPAMKRLEAAGLLPSTGPGSQEALDQVNRFRTSDKPRPEDEILHDWERGFARTSDFWGNSPERRMSDDLLLYLPSQDFRLTQDLPEGYLTDGRVQDLFHLNPKLKAAMPPGLAETKVNLRPIESMSLADSMGEINYTYPHLMDRKTRARLKDYPFADGRVFSEGRIDVTANPRAIEDITAHEFLGHGPHMTEVGNPYIRQLQEASRKPLTEAQNETPATEALARDYTRMSNERWSADEAGDKALVEDLTNEMYGVDKRLGAAEDITNYHDKPSERWARWVQAQHGMSLDDVRPPGLNDNFFSTDYGNASSQRLTGMPFVMHRPYPFDEGN